MDKRSNQDHAIVSDGEERVCRFSGWYTKTGYSLEYWEIFVTSRCLIFCCIGESFHSLLLKADMGATNRDRLSDLNLSEIAAFDERNFAVPAAQLRVAELTSGSVLKKPSLSLKWSEDEMEFYHISDATNEGDAMSSLSDHNEYAHVSTDVSNVQSGPISNTLRQIYSLLSGKN